MAVETAHRQMRLKQEPGLCHNSFELALKPTRLRS
jgi:hypothetical protein